MMHYALDAYIYSDHPRVIPVLLPLRKRVDSPLALSYLVPLDVRDNDLTKLRKFLVDKSYHKTSASPLRGPSPPPPSLLFSLPTKVARVRLNVVGQDGVGKTCLVRLLLGQAFEEQASTCGIDLSKASVTLMKSHCSTTEDDPTTWQLLSWKEHKKKLNQAFGSAYRPEAVQKQEEEEEGWIVVDVDSPEEFQKQEEMKGRHRSSFIWQEDTFQDKRLQSLANHPLTKEQIFEIEELVNDSTQFGGQTDVILMTICDFGGQEPFLTAHAALMPSSPLSMYMLVFNGAQLLTDKATSTFRMKDISGQTVHELQQKLCRMQTNDDFLKHWSSSVLIAHPPQQAGPLLSEEVERLPAIFPIATHRKLAEEAKFNKGHESVDFIKANDDHLQHLFRKNECLYHFVSTSSLNLDVCFPVENKTSSTDDSIAREIRNKVNKIAQSYWQKQAKQPASWLKFEDAIGELTRITKRHTAGLDEVKQVARLCHIFDERELQDALRHLMKVGAVYHFPEIPGLKNIVFHDFNWLFDLLASFVGSAHSKPKRRRRYWQEAVESGFLSLQLVNYLLKNVAEVEERDCDAAKGILCHFDVLVEKEEGSSHKGYYSACFIQDDFRGGTKFSQAFKCSQKTSLPFPLIIFAKDILFFPEPLYFRLATRIIGKYSMASADSVPLKRNRLIFFISPGVNAEFLYQGTRNCVSVTLFPNNERKFLAEEHKSKLPEACRDFREWLIRSVDDAKKRGMAGLQTELYCQVEEAKPNGQLSKTLAKLEGFSTDTDMWSVADASRQLDNEELYGIKLWFDKSKIGLPAVADRDKPLPDLILAVCRVGQRNWRHIGMNLRLSVNNLEQIRQDNLSNVTRLSIVIEDWMRGAESPTTKELFAACKQAGIARRPILKEYEEIVAQGTPGSGSSSSGPTFQGGGTLIRYLKDVISYGARTVSKTMFVAMFIAIFIAIFIAMFVAMIISEYDLWV